MRTYSPFRSGWPLGRGMLTGTLMPADRRYIRWLTRSLPACDPNTEVHNNINLLETRLTTYDSRLKMRKECAKVRKKCANSAQIVRKKNLIRYYEPIT
ncbi:MAG: hypothetical protein K0Q79_2040 [Flavipsychrobacter sp.]|nr:hypothetical protein [Flavipsychrobacter sp.]